MDRQPAIESLPLERLREVLHYDPETGVFIWLIRSAQKIKIGDIAGSLHKAGGYIYIRIGNFRYRAHRLAWLYMTGEWPEGEIDHRDLNRSNNRFNNLREATRQQNSANGPMRSTNTSGVKGVCWNKKSEKWLAQIGAEGKHFYLGEFDTLQEATRVRQAAAERLHREFMREDFR